MWEVIAGFGHSILCEQSSEASFGNHFFCWRFNYVIGNMKSFITVLTVHFIYRSSGQMDMERARQSLVDLLSLNLFFFLSFQGRSKKGKPGRPICMQTSTEMLCDEEGGATNTSLMVGQFHFNQIKM